MLVLPPKKPFDTFKWRWAVLTPTESLNDPAVFLGVLRVLSSHEGKRVSSADFLHDLERAQRETNFKGRLARSQDRNLVRNSGQYWKALGVLQDSRSGITLSELGRRFASGAITVTEFGATTVQTLTLPNRQIQTDSDIELWNRAKLQIRPLRLILEVLLELGRKYGSQQNYLTPKELTSVLIPLSGAKVDVKTFADCIYRLRIGKLDISNWPDCAPAANDRRMAREFLLFLYYYGFCRKIAANNQHSEKYMLEDSNDQRIGEMLKLGHSFIDANSTIQELRMSGVIEEVTRARILREVLYRPEQQKFRKSIINAYKSKCLITGTSLDSVLEAAHIMPVERSNDDTIKNGICLRSDVHCLFDSGHLRIDPQGNIHLSEVAKAQEAYNKLIPNVKIPSFVEASNISWRWKYY